MAENRVCHQVDDTSSDSSDSRVDLESPVKIKRTRRGLNRCNVDLPIERSQNIYTNRIDYFENKMKEKIVYHSDDDDADKEESNTCDNKTINTHEEISEISIIERNTNAQVSPSGPPSESHSIPASPSPPRNDAILPKRKVRLKRGIGKVLDKLERIEHQYMMNKVFDNVVNEQESLNEDVICIDDLNSQNNSINLKIRLNLKIIQISVNREQKFFEVMHIIAADNKIEFEEILLTHNDVQLKPDSTPAAMKLTSADIIECYILKKNGSAGEKNENQENMMKIKIQWQGSKKKLDFFCHKFAPMSKLLENFAKSTKCDLNKLIVRFDGEIVDRKLSPLELDIDDGDCLDVYFT